MKLNKTLTLTALVATSLFAGSALQAQDAPKDKPADATGGPGMRRPMLSLDSVAKQLDLTDEQKIKAKPIVEELQKKVTDLRQDTALAQEDRRAKMKELRDGATAKLKEILTADQFAKWEKMGPGGRRPGGAGGPPAAAGGEGAKTKAATPKN